MRWKKTAHFQRINAELNCTLSFKKIFLDSWLLSWLGRIKKVMGKMLEVNVFIQFQRTVYCSSKNPLGVVHASLFCHPSSYHQYSTLINFCSYGICGVVVSSVGISSIVDVHLKPFLIKSIYVWNDEIKHCSLELYSAILFVGFLSWHRFVLNLEIRPSCVFCWRWRGHQSRLRGVFFKLYSVRGISQQHKSTFFTSLSMELTLGQASLALGHCRNYR